MQMYSTDFGTLWERARAGCSERAALRMVYSPGWAGPGWMQGMGAQGWCTGKTRRDGMGGWCGREVRDGEHMWIHGWLMSMSGENHCNTVR